jgi:GT2 family glycosyltransferase
MSIIAVVVLNYNGKSHLEKFLPSVVSNSGNVQIIVADNGSSDGSIDFIKKNFPIVRIIDNGSNLGFCGGYNRALNNVEADYFVLLNNDVEVTPNWISPLHQLLDKNPSIAAAQPKILSYNAKDHFEYAGAGGGLIDTLAYPFCRGRIFDTVEKDTGQYNDTVPVFWATGACMIIRSSWYRKFGGLDEDFFAHMEEIDLCWKLKRARQQVYYCGDSTVYHVGGGTLAAGNPRKTYYNFRNGLALMLKHFSLGQLLWKLPLRIVLDWVAAVRFLLGSPQEFAAVIKAHFYVLLHLGRIFSKRRELKKIVEGYEAGEVYRGVVIVDYFLKGRKTFLQLRDSN